MHYFLNIESRISSIFSTFSPFVHNNALIQAAYLIERQEISFVSDDAIIVGSRSRLYFPTGLLC